MKPRMKSTWVRNATYVEGFFSTELAPFCVASLSSSLLSYNPFDTKVCFPSLLSLYLFGSRDVRLARSENLGRDATVRRRGGNDVYMP